MNFPSYFLLVVIEIIFYRHFPLVIIANNQNGKCIPVYKDSHTFKLHIVKTHYFKLIIKN